MQYLDASALVKLVVREPETEALFTYLRGNSDWVASAICYVEVIRNVERYGPGRAELARTVLDRVRLVAPDEAILSLAAGLEPTSLRTLDAIHIATALLFGDELDALVTYDRRMQEAAASHGMRFAAPV